MTTGATRAPRISLVTVLLRFAVQHVARGTDRSPEERVGAEDRRAQSARASAKQRLFTGAVTAGRKACADRNGKVKS